MYKFYWLCLTLFLFSCHDKKPSLSDNQPINADDFFAAFQPLKPPYNAADTTLSDIGDTTTVSLAVLEQFIPDSALLQKQTTNTVFHPVGKIETKNDLYLLLIAKQGKKTTLSAYLFAKDKKKMTYVSHISLLTSGANDGYVHSVDINSEPTFTITKNKTVDGQLLYSRNGYAYSNSAKAFIEVINESNENGKKNGDIINPIDTLARVFKLSGDYSKDKTNFISLRDGNIAGRYTFFLHFEKKDDCSGELKGSLSMIDATRAVFQQSGDPCVIDFTFGNNTIKVKERGSCGNHRDLTCQFDDTYRKTSPQPKGGKKTK